MYGGDIRISLGPLNEWECGLLQTPTTHAINPKIHHNNKWGKTPTLYLSAHVLKSNKIWSKMNLYQILNKFFLRVLLRLVSSLHIINSSPAFQVFGLDQEPAEGSFIHPYSCMSLMSRFQIVTPSQHSWRPMEGRVDGGRRLCGTSVTKDYFT